MTFIQVRHNIEVAHRLSLTPGKCEAIHGHSMWVTLRIYGWIDERSGILNNSLEFGRVKKQFRTYLDTTFDHRLLLNKNDPWATKLMISSADPQEKEFWAHDYLPGLAPMPGDPTTENIAKWIARWASEEFATSVDALVEETSVNAAGYYAGGKKS